ncbi:hypothetical protein Goarm_000043 [Gossypium armourianum]|uniref:Myb/SANT-like domain-containing protein n=1 Tax=Gossypium armourianum TaxID=34283 RepID=A0A7J9KFW3_9ROSI|nr:hypothetical protein [Gossypium armourianum]
MIRTLKMDWTIIYDMLCGKENNSFGWDEHRQMSHKAASQFRHRSFSYYDQLTSIYAKDRATRNDAQTTAYIVEEIDAEDVTTANNLEERNNYRGYEDDVSLDEIDVSITQS